MIGYEELPGLPAPDRRRATPVRSSRVMIAGVPVAILQGRAHLYEGGPIDELRAPVRWLKAAGAEILVQTNAAGSLRPEVGPGSLMAITDHINLTGTNVLIGPNDDSIGPRFPSMGKAYDPELLVAAARRCRRAGSGARRGRLHRLVRPGVRDRRGDPRDPHPRWRRRRHVDRARDRRCPPLRSAGGCDLGDHEPGRGHERGAAQPRADADRRRPCRRGPGPGCSSASSRGLRRPDADRRS